MEDTVIVGYMVFVIVTVESKVELIKAEAFAVLRIAFCFFELADHSVVHGKSLLF
jgi:hypothetical protein